MKVRVDFKAQKLVLFSFKNIRSAEILSLTALLILVIIFVDSFPNLSDIWERNN